ncbi:MAG: hypothetical protein QOE33_1548 [Acidobacteriota bacterium]|nr:hypothetical protein [Acidobacteriota bacterium]
MTRRKQARNLLTTICALLVAVVFAGAGFAALAQNTNSSTTQDTMAQNGNMSNTNMSTPHRRRGRRGSRRASSGNMNTGEMNANASDTSNTNMSGTSMQTNDNSNMSGGMSGNMNMGRHGRRGRRGRRASMMPAAADTTSAAPPAGTSGAMQTGGMMNMGTAGSDVDLSGTYTGTVSAPDMNMNGPATLTITGNTFTLDAGGSPQSGTLTAHQWPGQIAVSMRFGTTLPATIVSLRAKKMGASGLSLMSIKGEPHSFSFTTGGGGRRAGRRGRHGMMAAPPPPAPEATATPADASAAPADASAAPAATHARRGGRRRGSRRGSNTNMNGNMGNTNNSNTPPPSN